MSSTLPAGADFGDLKKRQTEYDFRFQYGQRTFKIKPTAEEVLNFHLRVAAIAADRGGNVPLTGVDIWHLAAPLLGGEFNLDTGEFSKDESRTGKDGQVILDLIKSGIDYDTLDYLLTGVYLRYQWGEDVAAAYMETGDLGKAFKSAQEKKNREDNPDQETSPAPGETLEDASDETVTD